MNEDSKTKVTFADFLPLSKTTAQYRLHNNDNNASLTFELFAALTKVVSSAASSLDSRYRLQEQLLVNWFEKSQDLSYQV